MSKQKVIDDSFEPNNERYRKCSEPRPIAECKKAMEEFSKELGELRVKYQIRDFISIQATTAIEEDGSASELFTTSGFGSRWTWEPMAATLYGQYKADREEMMRKLMKGTP